MAHLEMNRNLLATNRSLFQFRDKEGQWQSACSVLIWTVNLMENIANNSQSEQQ